MKHAPLPPGNPRRAGKRHATLGGLGATLDPCPEDPAARVRTVEPRAWRGLAGFALLALGSFAAPSLPAGEEIKGPAPVSVSAVNYRATPRERRDTQSG
jgi:hypothetical protein